jgi:TolB-like protein/Tfp pilus assembly protein PilF
LTSAIAKLRALWRDPDVIFRFENQALDGDRRELRRDGALIPVEPQVFDLLLYLVRNRDRVVNRDDLLKVVWHGRIVSESALTSRINAARQALNDSGEQQRLIRTVVRRGFRFVGTAREDTDNPDGASATAGKARPNSDRISIAVLPFTNMSGDPEQDHFADGMVEEITVALGRVPGLFVIARNSSFAFKGKTIDVRDVGRQLGVRYAVEGSVRRSGDRVRVAAELIDTSDGTTLWAERYERRVQDIFDIQDELTKEIVTALRVHLTDGELAAVWLRSTNNIEAWGYATRGADHIWRGTALDMAQARAFLERAVACDPGYAKAAALIALTHYFDIRFNYKPAKDESQRLMAEQVYKAIQLNPEEPYAIWMRANLKSLEGRFDDAVDDARLAVAKNPNDAHCWLGVARLSVNAGRPAEGEQAIRHAMRLNPFYPINYLAVLGDALIHQGQGEAALEVFNEIVKRQPAYISAHLHLAALYSDMDKMDAARAAVAQVLRLDPHYRVKAAGSFYLSADEARKQVFLDSLRAAGLPD